MAKNIFIQMEENVKKLKDGGVTPQDKKKVDNWLAKDKKTATTPSKPITKRGPVKDTVIVKNNLEADRVKKEYLKKGTESSRNVFRSVFETSEPKKLPSIRVESQYANLPFSELTKLRNMADNDEKEGYITSKEARTIRDEIDYYRARNGRPEELKPFLENAYKSRGDRFYPEKREDKRPSIRYFPLQARSRRYTIRSAYRMEKGAERHPYEGASRRLQAYAERGGLSRRSRLQPHKP